MIPVISWRGESIPKLVVGSVQLGQNYGIANQTGQPNFNEVEKLCSHAISSGCTFFDTAQAYGESEEVLGKYIEESISDSDINIIWQCGEKNYDVVKTNKISSNIRLVPYIDDINIAYSAADLVISRAGALALSEISLFKKAMIVIPLANSAQNHQLTNAKYYESNNAAIIIEESQLSKLVVVINKLIDSDNTIKELESNIEKISKPNATKDIYNIIDGIIRNRDV